MLPGQKIMARLCAQLLCGVLFWLFSTSSVQATSQNHPGQFAPQRAPDKAYTVTKTDDTNDGACNSDCSLREAIVAANANSGPDIITLPVGIYNLTLTGAGGDDTKGDLDIYDDLVIEGVDGATTIIDGGAQDRLLHIARPPSGAVTAPSVTLRRVTLRNGKATNGGAIYSQGNLTIEGVTLDNNEATENGGGLACMDETADFTIRNSVIRVNRALNTQLFQGAGAGVYFSRCGTLTVTQTTFQANFAQNGGAIYLNESGYAISQSSVINNLSLQNGAGIFVGSAAGGEIHTSTLSRNEASGSGGGIYIGGDASATLKQVTIANNQADVDQSGDGDGGGLYSRGFFRLSQSILAGNKDGGGELTPDCATTFAEESQSLGYNVIQESAGCNLTGTLTSNITGIAAQLGPLQANGGPTLTHLPATNSPVRDLVLLADCANPVDQRGVTRPQGANCDSGAVEAEPLIGCDLIASNEAALRRAITCINGAGSGVYTLTLTADISYTQPISTISNLLLTRLLIAGNGHTLDAQGHGRVLDLNNVQNATLRDLTLTGGRVDDAALEPNGGGLALNCSNDDVASETLCQWTLINTVVRNNQAASGGGIDYRCDYHGGGALVVQDSVIRDNQATGLGGGIFYSSDEESRACALTLRNTRVEGNRAVEGGGIRIFRPRVTIIDSAIRNNRASERGGGLMARISDGFITMTVRGSTISGNEAGLNGGGLYIASPEQTFDIDLANSTVSGNRVISGTGGGLFLGARASSLNILLFNSTVAQNTAGQGAGVYILNRDNTALFTNTLQLNNTLIADNPGGDCAGEIEGRVGLPPAQLISLGNNLDSDGSCLTAAVAQASDIVSGTANLGPLADNGGATQTHTLRPGSDAIDAGNDATCATAPVNGVDQRGVARPQRVHCDIGAVEMVPTTGGDCDYVASDEASLRKAIICVNNGGAGIFTITVTADISYTQVSIPITNTQAERVVIQGNGHTLNANQHGRAVTVNTLQHLIVHDLTLTGGQGDQPTVPVIAGWGGGLLVYCGELGECFTDLQKVNLYDNQANEGGGLAVYCYVDTHCVTTVQDSAIHHNQALDGGGTSTAFDEENFAFTLALTNTVVHHNSAETGGGIRSRGGGLTLVDSSIYENQAALGGGIGIRTAYFLNAILRNSTIHTNRAFTSGGGIYVFSPDNGGGTALTVANSTVSNNMANDLANSNMGIGGGLYFASDNNSVRAHLINSTISANLAAVGSGAFFLNQNSGLPVTPIATLTNTIIAENYQIDCVSDGFGASEQPLRSGGHNLDDDGSCLTAAVAQPSDIVSGTAHLSIVTDNGGPTWTQVLLPGSDAIDTGNDQVCAAAPINGVDQRGITRPQGAHCDMGAFEATSVNTATRQVFVSSTSSGQAGAVHFRDEDILHYDPANNTWALLFDGSDVGITDDVDAFAFQDDGSLLLSLSNPVTVTGLGLVDDSDIVKFVATSLGVTTTGTFAWYLDGSDVGLESEAEDIDAIDFAPDGRLLISISNNGLTAPGIDGGHDEDAFVLNNGVFGADSAGLWTLYLDGSAVAISTGRDINGLWADPANGELYLSTNGPYIVTGVSGDQDDILVCTPSELGAASACTFRLFWDGDAAGFGDERLDGIDIGAAPATFNPGASAIVAADTAGAEPSEEAAEGDEESINPLYLPVIGNAQR